MEAAYSSRLWNIKFHQIHTHFLKEVRHASFNAQLDEG
jgi:hypothetical protein